MRLKEKVAIITGGSGHVGTATCKKLAGEGAIVVVNGLHENKVADTVQQVTTQGGVAEPLVFDVTMSNEVIAAIDGAAEKYGHIDILVNVAGGPKNNLVTEMTDEEWDYAVDLNLKGSFNCIKAVVRHMKRQKGGKIVNTSSTSKQGVPWFSHSGQANYASANAGLIGLMRALTYELAPYNININCVIPGPIETPKSRDNFAKLETDPRVRVSPLALIPLGRLGTPQDVANGIAFLVSEEADYITGATLNICGGLF